MGKKINMTGRLCGRLTVVRESPVRKSDNRIHWECICSCGNVVTVMGKHLVSGHTQSCGCYKKEKTSERHTTHGRTRSKVYNAWCNIKARCYDPSNVGYQNYGGKGIEMHEDFKYSFERFYAEVGEPPDETRMWSIDRIDYSKNYTYGNIRWANTFQQAQNRGKTCKNTSGFTGVSFMDNGKNVYWCALWRLPGGKQQTKCFSIAKLGYDVALEMAINARKEAITALNLQGAEYSENHGM